MPCLGQTMEQVVDNVAKALELDIPHMSLYSLILENHTVFMNRQRRGNLHLPNEDVESDMFDYILQELEKNGFEHYEISNFTKPGFESRHNLMYWENSEYYGLGAGASGYIDGMRYRNRGPIQHYLKSIREKAILAYTKNFSARPSRWKKRCFWAYGKNWRVH